MDTVAQKFLLTVEEAAARLSIGVEDIQDLIDTNAIPAFGSKKQIIRVVDIIAFVKPTQMEYQSALTTNPSTNERITSEPESDSLNLIQTSTSSMLFKNYFAGYLKTLAGCGISGEGMSTRTLEGYLLHAKHIFQGLGHMKMSDIDKTVIRNFLNELTMKTYKRKENEQPRHYSQSVINKVFDLLHGAIKIAADEDNNDRVFQNDFMAYMKKPRTRQIKLAETQALSDREIQYISNVVASNRMINTWIHILLYTGVRPSEALGLRFSDIDYRNCTISIMRTLSYQVETTEIDGDTHKKKIPIIKNLKNVTKSHRYNYQKRTLRVSDKLLVILKEWEQHIRANHSLMEKKRKHRTEGFLFCGSKGQLWLYDDYKQLYNRVLEKNGIPAIEFNPYRYRHNYCTRALRMGKDIKTVQLMLGDNTADMVLKVYANMNKDDVLLGSGEYSIQMDKILIGDLAESTRTTDYI